MVEIKAMRLNVEMVGFMADRSRPGKRTRKLMLLGAIMQPDTQGENVRVSRLPPANSGHASPHFDGHFTCSDRISE